MWRIIGLVLLLLAIPATLGGELSPEEKALQGAWKVIKSIKAGEEVPQKGTETTILVIDGTTVRVREGEEENVLCTFKIMATEPKGIDFRWVFKERRGQVDRAIYKIEGKTLTLCIQEDAKEPRPKEFVSKKDTHIKLIVLQKI